VVLKGTVDPANAHVRVEGRSAMAAGRCR
jgi:hypothetical protein